MSDLGTTGYACIGCSCCAILITAIVLIAVSFDTIEPNEVGLRYNTITETIDKSELWSNGRHFLGVGQRFIKFPNRVEAIKFDGGSRILGRTEDGLPIELAVSFQYRLLINVDDLYNLFIDYGEMDAITTVYKRIARNKVREVASNYTAFSFFTSRSLIEGDMAVRLAEGILEARGQVETFELLDITLPEQFEAARVRQLSASEDIETARQEKEKVTVTAQTRVNRAQVESVNFRQLAEGYRSGELFRLQGDVAALRARLRADAEAYGDLTEKLGLGPDQLLAYKWIQSLNTARDTGSRISYTIDSPHSLDEVDTSSQDL